MFALAFVVVACAPPVDGPAERARTADAQDGAALERALAALPGATSAHAVLHRGFHDPLAGTDAPASAAVLVVVDDRANVSDVEAAAKRLVHAAAPDIAAPEVIVAVGAHRPELARVGPFTVDARSKRLLAGVLVAGLALVAALAGYVALRARQ
jgi:type III secretory pathway lipoprotein EscJ